jgi:hypothetical protein
MKTALTGLISLLLVTPANCHWSALPGKTKAEVETMCGSRSRKHRVGDYDGWFYADLTIFFDQAGHVVKLIPCTKCPKYGNVGEKRLQSSWAGATMAAIRKALEKAGVEFTTAKGAPSGFLAIGHWCSEA